uniref:ATP synthase subunit delta', mitochondrial n=1 Tax=Nicotiana tabacum TaxID=4097 RepID=A0A1S4BEW5_TOBAC|nr:PREDICTED: ATP synthase subunit delta', mitochondrial-like [Nicotiana tabacum]
MFHLVSCELRYQKTYLYAECAWITSSAKLLVQACLFFLFILQVDMVIIPATTGQMGVLPGHVATIAELKPGLLSVHEGNDVTKYFVSGGFAFVHANSFADIIAIEAVPLDQIDPNLVQKGLTEFTQKLSTASTDVEKAEAQIGVDVHSALNAALTG